MKAKTKTKKTDRKFSRHKFPTKDPPKIEIPKYDLSNICKPIDTSLCNLYQVTKLFETANEEIKCILTYECEVIYECKICRSLFRSLLNFISHKRIYCVEKFNISNNKNVIDPQVMVVEKPVDSECKENHKVEKSSKNPALDKKFSKKDLTSVITMLQKKQTDPNYDDVEEQNRRTHIIADTEQVLLEVLDSNRAAFQTVFEPMLSNIAANDLMKAQTTELQNLLSRDTAILGPDGQIVELSTDEKSSDSLQYFKYPDNTENENLVCSICNINFSTKKTLTFHIKSLHTPNRLVYPCTCCNSLFPSTWGVYRHLVKVHRKSNTQVRKLRAEIQAKAYLRESTRAQDIDQDCADDKLNSLNELRSTNETQEWMTHLESDTELQRCGGCNKRFDRKAALLAHSQICQRRQAACNDVATKSKRSKVVSETTTEKSTPEKLTSTPEVGSSSVVESQDIPTKKISTESESLVTSSEDPDRLLNLPNVSPAVTITRLSQRQPPAEISIRVEGVASLSKDAWEKMGNEASALSLNTDVDLLRIPSDTTPTKTSPNDNVSDDPEIIFTNIEKAQSVSGNKGSKKRKMGKSSTSTDSNKRINLLMQGKQEKKNSTETNSSPDKPEDKMTNFSSPRKFECIPCKRTFSNLTNLRRHMAEHISWNRFRCKLCDFECFDKIDCVAHCNKIHNAKNSRTSIANMIIESPLNEKPTDSSRGLLKKHHILKDSAKHKIIDGTKSAISTNDVKVNQKVNSSQHDVKEINKSGSSTDENGSCSPKLDEELSDEKSELVKKASLDEDPELRRMVMEVIFGSSETVNEQPGSSAEVQEIRDYKKISKISSKVCSEDKSSLNRLETMQSLQNNNRLARHTRNRTKVENKDFIYDLDAVLVKESADDELCATEIIGDNNKSTNIMKDKFTPESDLTVVLYRDRGIAESKFGKVA
ncbi:zinc finger protein 800 [Microplitis mediator]|uniref:zinc finger protein 800 n=1 Tax=Microplitis mediator TaxID=375433 RepID=UPI002557365D|nr:zinc finger protein 800 [Microplitis mediator]